jgi:Transposase IS66 family/IS66 C-terminal element
MSTRISGLQRRARVRATATAAIWCPRTACSRRCRLGKKATPISPIALEAVKRIHALFDIERDINGFWVEKRLAARQEKSAALVAALEAGMRARRAKLSRRAAVAKAMDYMLTRWEAFTRFLDDGRISLPNNGGASALGRKSWLFAGSERGAERAALMYTLLQSAKLDEVDPQAWLADVLARITDTPQTQLAELLPWKWASNVPIKRPDNRGLRRRVTAKVVSRRRYGARRGCPPPSDVIDGRHNDFALPKTFHGG